MGLTNSQGVAGCTGRVCISVGANFYITLESHFYDDVQEFLVRTNELAIITRGTAVTIEERRILNLSLSRKSE